MSGIEIAGIVLGSFPLLISIFEHYRDVAKAAGLLTSFQEGYLKNLNDVKDEELLFRLNVEVLLLPLSDDETIGQDDLERLLADIGGPGWEEDDLQDALRRRLGSIFDRYMEIMQNMQATLWKLLDAMGVNKRRFQARLNKPAVSYTQIGVVIHTNRPEAASGFE